MPVAGLKRSRRLDLSRCASKNLRRAPVSIMTWFTWGAELGRPRYPHRGHFASAVTHIRRERRIGDNLFWGGEFGIGLHSEVGARSRGGAGPPGTGARCQQEGCSVVRFIFFVASISWRHWFGPRSNHGEPSVGYGSGCSVFGSTVAEVAAMKKKGPSSNCPSTGG